MNKKEYTAPAIEALEDFTSELLADSDPSEWDIINGPGGSGNQNEDDSEESMSKRGGFTSWNCWDDDDEF